MLLQTGQKLLFLTKKQQVAEEEWNSVVSETLEAIKACNRLSEIKQFIELDSTLDFPEAVRELALERQLELGDFSLNALHAYLFHLQMYPTSPNNDQLAKIISSRVDRLRNEPNSAMSNQEIGEYLVQQIAKLRHKTEK